MGVDDWGPMKWEELHSISVKLEEDPMKFAQYLESFVDSIPCSQCRLDFRIYVDKHPVHNETNPVIWAIDAHNYVNEKTEKRVLSYEEALMLVKPKFCVPYSFIGLLIISVMILFFVRKLKSRPMKK